MIEPGCRELLGKAGLLYCLQLLFDGLVMGVLHQASHCKRRLLLADILPLLAMLTVDSAGAHRGPYRLIGCDGAEGFYS